VFLRRHPARLLVVSFCAVLIAAGIAGLPLYVRPQTDQLRRADAILVLGGYGYDRYRLALELGHEGWATTVMVSNPNGPKDPWLYNFCATPSNLGFTLHCFEPSPETTKGEGRELKRLATANSWRTVIVVTSLPHISRARFVLEQCFDGDLVMVASSEKLSLARWALEYVYQTAGYIRAMLNTGC
jgi:uncharacterized SAM-binding protein YcdF (DUF218 family)